MTNANTSSKDVVAGVLVFVRHAHRDKPLPDADNGLSAKGFCQVEELVKDYKKAKLPSSELFWTSPKLRCRETLGPIALAASAELKIEKLLDEQSFNEDRKVFLLRLETLITKINEMSETLYLCSHGDVIPEVIDLLTGRQVDVSKGQAIVVVKHKNSKWEIL